MIFYISDLHLFHHGIIAKANRPFHNVDEMHETIINNWNETVTDKDTVYILGDLGLYHQKEITEIMKRLHGTKVLITGNHDPKNLRDRGLKKCFQEVIPYKEIIDDTRIVVLFHYPIEEWDGFFRNFYHLHGHVHCNDLNLKKLPGRFNVSVESVEYRPRTLNQLIDHYEKHIPWSDIS